MVDGDELSERLGRLNRATGELGRAETIEEVSEIIVEHTADAVGATIATLMLLEGDELHLVSLRGGARGEAEEWATISLSQQLPTTDAVRTGQRVVVTGAAELARLYPGSRDRGERSIVCLPLNVRGATIGVIGLSMPGPRTIATAELEFFEILAAGCAQALQRIAAWAEADKQASRLALLADASAELAASLDYEATLTKVSQLVVPTFADWCAIDVVKDGRLRRLSVAHVDPAKVELARQLEERYPSNPNSLRGAWNVMRTGRPELIAEVTEEMLVAAAIDAEHERVARDLGLRSAIIVPLVARDRVLGVITWVNAESGRLYTEDDLAFAENLAQRAAIAIDNAELHSETLAAAERLQHAVLPESIPHVPGWQITAYYDPAGRTDVGGDFYDAIPLDDGRLALFVGDVMGRGVAAAAAMAQMRAAVRSFVAIDPDPERVVANLDLMFERYPTDQLVTLLYLVTDTATDEVVMVNAGHPPPLLLHGDGTVEQLPGADGCPLGVQPDVRRNQRASLRQGDTLLLYTDGLIERREEDIDVGLGRLLAAMPTLTAGDLAVAVKELVFSLRDPSRDDDVAAMAAKREAPADVVPSVA